MRPLEDIARVMPPDAIEMRVLRHRVHSSASQAASEWLGDTVFGAEDGATDGPPPLKMNEIHWYTAAGVSVPIRLGPDEVVEPDDLARLMTEARRRRLRFSVWSQGGSPMTPRMEPTAMWFTGTPGPDASPTESPDLEELVTPHGTLITVEEHVAPQVLWLLFFPIMIVTFAWVVFLFLGGLPRTVREIWQRGARGVDQQYVATLDADELRVTVTRNGKQRAEVSIPRDHLVAFGTVFGFTAYTTAGAVALPAEWGASNVDQQRALVQSVNARLNRAIAAT